MIYNKYTLLGKYRNVHEFLKKKKLVNSENETFFIDNFANKGVLNYFYELVLNKYLELDIWENCGQIATIKSQILNVE